MNSVRGKVIYTGNSVVEDAFVVFNGPKVVAVAKAPRGEVLGDYPAITPAFLDAHSHIGMTRSGEPGSEAEANERLDSILALPDALDSVQLDDASFRDAMEMGVLYSCVVPGSGNIIGGLSAVIRHYAPDSTQALVARAGLKAAFGYNPMSTRDWKGDRAWTRMGAISLLRKALHDVREKAARWRKARPSKRQEIAFSAAEGVLRDVLDRKVVLRCHVHKIDDIAALLRLTEEFSLRITVEHACDVHEAGIFRELARRDIPVIYGPVDSFSYKVELKHENWRNIRCLIESGVPYGLMTDHPFSLGRTLFIQTRWFTRCGLSKQAAVELVSRRNAEILGVDDRLGTLQKGKWASFACWSGDPFELTSFPIAVYGEGRCVFQE